MNLQLGEQFLSLTEESCPLKITLKNFLQQERLQMSKRKDNLERLRKSKEAESFIFKRLTLLVSFQSSIKRTIVKNEHFNRNWKSWSIKLEKTEKYTERSPQKAFLDISKNNNNWGMLEGKNLKLIDFSYQSERAVF